MRSLYKSEFWLFEAYFTGIYGLFWDFSLGPKLSDPESLDIDLTYRWTFNAPNITVFIQNKRIYGLSRSVSRSLSVGIVIHI